MRGRLTLDAGRVGVVDAIVAAIRGAAAFVRRIAGGGRRRRQAWESRRALRGLDGHALSDLGIDRSEIGSVASEMAGLTDATRLRALLNSHLFP